MLIWFFSLHLYIGADLIGSSLFALGFLFLNSIQDPNALDDEIGLTLNQTMSSTLNATMNSLSNLMINSTQSPFIDTSTIANTLSTLIANNQTELGIFPQTLTETATVLANMTTQLV